ncbi:MAG: PD-(D/E)XK nuclease family protein [Acidimicrobiaceae bacterium]|nr:PD-(D/E)XK nuclease family protein [Acidimicrobiaceae bacterium]MXZ97839.1 PD-(D/E)XK nuclease family protein [Acidimicrobiaceae bacterium]MYE77008.1 PD-(D/E)XK nuclease family protein [Acidimicrobiaceae bacterium]MYE97232.1 PD-(D/E)XK nuclease family protein [Acidimicrobiaceae bacterium]MYH44952.1 PD-(D/E)XK nuclease family protein [Acidimicrobiaceae bacterium]
MQLEFDPADMLDPAGVGAVGEDGRPSPPERLSPSGAATFEQCPRRWRFRYVDRLPDPPGEEALIGTFTHRVLEHLMQRHPGRRTKDDARRIARASWPEMSGSDDYRDLELDDEQALEFRWKAWRAIEGLWELEDPSGVEVQATEQQLSVTLDGVPFRGVVDRVESEPDGLVISDYKSGRAPTPRYAPSRLQQVLLYAAAVAAETGEQPVRARLLYLGQKIVATGVTPVELGGAVEQLKSTWDAIGDACHADDFSAQPGPLCGYCPYVERCTEGQTENLRRSELRAAEEESLLRLAG